MSIKTRKLTIKEKAELKEAIQSRDAEPLVWAGDKYYCPFTERFFQPEELSFPDSWYEDLRGAYFAREIRLYNAILDFQRILIQNNYRSIPEFKTDLSREELKIVVSGLEGNLLLSDFYASSWPGVVYRRGIYLIKRNGSLSQSSALKELRRRLDVRKRGFVESGGFNEARIIFYNLGTSRFEEYFENKEIDVERVIPVGYPVHICHQDALPKFPLPKREFDKMLFNTARNLGTALVRAGLDGITNGYMTVHCRYNSKDNPTLKEFIALGVVQPCFYLSEVKNDE